MKHWVGSRLEWENLFCILILYKFIQKKLVISKTSAFARDPGGDVRTVLNHSEKMYLLCFSKELVFCGFLFAMSSCLC
jgi:hypothetical protein